MSLKSFINRIRGLVSEDEYITRLKNAGVIIGEGIRIFSPNDTRIDVQNPHMISIGKNVRITAGCVILTHDYSWSVISGVSGYIYGGTGSVHIGDNVFIGMNTVILKNTMIGNNVIIGAGSIVHGDIESNSVYAGSPARRICSLQEFELKKKQQAIDEVKKTAKIYQERSGKKPDEHVLREYFYLFKNRNEPLSEEQIGLMKRTGNYDLCKETYFSSEPIFDGIDGLLHDIGI